MSLFHAVDVLDNAGSQTEIPLQRGHHDSRSERPDSILLPLAASPFWRRETDDETKGIVDNVVFPTGIDPREDLGDRVFDVYYGMADYKIGAARLTLGQCSGTTPSRRRSS